MATRTIAEVQDDLEVLEAVAELKKELGQTLPGEAVPQDISDPTQLVRVYTRATGEPHDVPLWTLEGKNSILLRNGPDGKREFSRTKPKDSVWAPGKVKCYLNPEHPDYKTMVQEVGLVGKSCIAAHLGSEFSLRIHMQHRHSQEWATIEAHRERHEREEDRENARIMARAALKQMGGS